MLPSSRYLLSHKSLLIDIDISIGEKSEAC